VAGAALDPAIQVEIVDGDGAVVSGATDAVTLVLAGGPSEAGLSGTKTINAVGGVATFSGLTVERAAEGYTLVASAGGIDPDTSSSFAIVPGPAAVLARDGEPEGAVAGDTLSALEVSVEDAYGNLIGDAELEVSVTIGSGPSGAVLGGTTTRETEAGAVVFDDLVLERAGERYSLRVSAAEVGRTETESFAISAGPATQLGFERVPNEAEGLEHFEVIVAVQDVYGNAVPGAAVWVDLDLGETPRDDAKLSGTTRIRAHEGKASFTAGIDRPGKGFTLRASSDGLGTAESDPFDVGLEIAQIATGYAFACAITTSKHAYCWGVGGGGQLGDGKEGSSRLPVPVSGEHTFERLAAGGYHACGLTEDGKAYCWGDNGDGRLGDGTTERRTEPVTVVGGHRFREIMTGQTHTCALTVTGDVYCWGENVSGRLGNGDGGTNQSEPVKVVGNHRFVTLTSEGGSVGFAGHTCAITDEGKTYCWGRNAGGQLGNGGGGDSDLPVLVSGDLDFATVSTGALHACAITESGNPYCWGNNGSGEVGNGDAGTRQHVPAAVEGGHTFTSISTDLYSTCALTESGEAYCWGQNNYGQLGDGSQDNRDQPTQVDGGHTFASIAVGPYYTCALTQNGELYCWGQNSSGQFGNGTTNSSLTPVRVEY
jgi:alpha-tubulin suppressor-like RCC1 family protein